MWNSAVDRRIGMYQEKKDDRRKKSMWYSEPAQDWSEALPVGNGRLGCMVYGRPDYEIIQLNEESVWTPYRGSRINPDAAKALAKIRQNIRAGKISQAEQEALYALSGVPESQSTYQTAGELYLNFDIEEPVTEYIRELDLSEGIVRIRYRAGETLYEREIFASYPDKILCIRISAAGRRQLNFDCHINRCRNQTERSIWLGDEGIGFCASTGENGIRFCTALRVHTCGGTKRRIGGHLVVRQASEAVIWLNIRTSFREEEYERICIREINQAAEVGYGQIRERHVLDFSRLSGRVEFQIGCGQERENPCTKKLLKECQNLQLAQLYFQYGRYLLISSSREGCLPATLQGIWNNSLTPPWDSKYTININLQMNYWAANTANLKECCNPFFELLERIKENGKETARQMYGCRGSVAHHNTDIYADTAPQDIYLPATYWPMGEAWLATHIWDYYRFTEDREFLEQHFDVLEQCLQFFEDFMIPNAQGYLVTSPSLSPENSYLLPDGTAGCLCECPAMDNEILSELLRGYMGACDILGKKEEYKRAKKLSERLPPLKISPSGLLQEWMEDYEETEPGHRHISHLYGLYPGTLFNSEDTPEMMEATRLTLERRLKYGGGHTGWSRAWLIGLWARLGDGERAWQNLKRLLSDSTFPNLMDTHPMGDGRVFQIDGNLGAIAAVIEMLVQSHTGCIELLPALPQDWDWGRVSGLCLRGAMEISFVWENGKVVQYEIISRRNRQVAIKVNGRVERLMLQSEKKYNWKEKK